MDIQETCAEIAKAIFQMTKRDNEADKAFLEVEREYLREKGRSDDEIEDCITKDLQRQRIEKLRVKELVENLN